MSTFALITGAAHGMGAEYARQLARRGYDLLLVDIQTDVNTLAQELAAQYKVEVHPHVMNLGREQAADELYQLCRQNSWQVEVLINNAGVYHDADIMTDTVAFNRTILALHITTPAMLCRLFGEDMKQRRKGYILNMCSITADMPIQRLGTYGSTKAFLSAYSRSLHIEMKDYGVYVLAVHPGAVDTGLFTIPRWLTRIGLTLGVIITPRYLVKRALGALFVGRQSITVPWLWGHVTILLVKVLPTGVLRLIRKLKIF